MYAKQRKSDETGKLLIFIYWITVAQRCARCAKSVVVDKGRNLKATRVKPETE